jgi:RNA polymerase sigma-70 factor (ECF subfamily)
LAPWLLRTLAHRYGLVNADAEDVVQESFIRLGRYSPDARARHPRALLLRIATNLTTDARRRLTARRAGNAVPIDDLARRPEPRLVQPEDQMILVDLKAAILSLPEPLRETFLLARFTPLTHVEIAHRLGISTKTVEWRISKAVATCLQQLAH